METTRIAKDEPVDMKLEVVVFGVSDIDRAKVFYENLGWRLDADFATGDDFRILQLEGLGANGKTRRAFWADRAAHESALRTHLLSLVTTRTRPVGNDPNVERDDPALWTDELAFLNQPGQADLQSDLFYDSRTAVDAYPKWPAWRREKPPRRRVIWGKDDLSFDLSEPEADRREVPNAHVHVLDAGPFAWTRRRLRSQPWSEALSALHV